MVYTLALRLFGVEATFLDMLGVLPVIFFNAAIGLFFLRRANRDLFG